MKPPGGGASELASPDAAVDVEAEDFDELELSPLTSLATFRNARAENKGVVVLSSNGELYLLNPATRDITPLPPYLPSVQNMAGPLAPGSKRELRFGKDSLQCRDNRPNRQDDKFCYFSRGMNYNALGVGADGTRYATLKVGQIGTPYEERAGSSKGPLFQVYRLAPGADTWEEFGAEFEFPYGKQTGGHGVNDLTFNGGQVAPDGTYYLSVTDLEGPDNARRLVAHVYKMTPQGQLQIVGDISDSQLSPNIGSNDIGSNDGDILFTESGDLVMGFTNHRADIPGSGNPGFNQVNFEVVTKETLDRADGTTLDSYPLTSAKIRAGKAKGEEFAGVGPAEGVSIGPGGNLVTANLTQIDSITRFMSISGNGYGNGSVSRIRNMPDNLGSYRTRDALPAWEYPLAKWDKRLDFSGNTYYVVYPWVGKINDMAGEAFVPSITVRKVVEGRANTNDQFKVSAQTASITKEATTSGAQKEVSTERIPVLAGTTVTVSEAITRSGATLADYSVSLSCTDGSTPHVTVDGSRATASITVTGTPGDVVCTFTNTPKADGKVEWAKEDEAGGLLGGSSWRIARRDGVPFTFDGSQNAEKSFVISDATATGGLDKDTDVGKFLLTGLAPGDYTLREETAPEGYQRSGETYTFTMTSPAQEVKKVHLFDGRQPVVGQFGRHNAVQNVPLTGTLLFEKRADQGKRVGTEPLLSGSEWILTNNKNTQEWRVTDCVAVHDAACQGTSHDTDSRAGVIRVTGLPLGKYELKEVKAPAGYVLDTTLKSFTIDSGHLDVKFEREQSIYNTKQAGPPIPLSGGIGRDFFVFLGVGVLGIALLMQLAQRRKRN